MKYGYFPGCSLEKNAYSYQKSTMAVAEPFGLEFLELDDWNCCGATEYISLNKTAAYALVARNLVLAKQIDTGSNGNKKQLIAPCSACFLNLSKAESYLTESPELANKINIALAAGGMHYEAGGLAVRHLLDVFVNDVGYEAIKEKVVKPLTGLRIAPYYGCYIVRPRFQGVFDDFEHPVTLDKLMKALGAYVIDFPLKAQCCGGHMTQISEPVAMDIINRLLRNAQEYNTDIIVTLCPMCQLNLDAYQSAVNRFYKTNYHIPVLYFTQMIGLALGMSAKELGIGSELVDARSALAKIDVEVPEPELDRKKRPSKTELPMPHMPEEV
jgi:heterodisulfide reductase subunit B